MRTAHAGTTIICSESSHIKMRLPWSWHWFQLRKCYGFRQVFGDDLADKLATVATNIARAAGRKKIPTEKMAKALNPKSRATVIPNSNDRPPRPTPSVRIIG